MINEILQSLQAEPGAWTVFKASTTSEIIRSSPAIAEIWSELLSDIDEVTLLYRHSDGSCLIFRYVALHFTILPALFTLKLVLTVKGSIDDLGIRHDLEDVVSDRHATTPNFWRLK